MATGGAPSRARSLAASSAPRPRLSMNVTPSRSTKTAPGPRWASVSSRETSGKGERVEHAGHPHHGGVAARLHADLDVLRGHGAGPYQGRSPWQRRAAPR